MAHLRRTTWLRARMFQAAFGLVRVPRALDLATRPVPGPATLHVPTRHGAVRCLVFRPHPQAPLAGDGPPPVLLLLHGGAFVGRVPEQDAHLARYVASEVGAAVVLADYDVAPRHRFPVAEEECQDVAAWLRAHAAEQGWDGARIAVGGTSAGGKLAMNVVQGGGVPLRAIVLNAAVADVTRTDRTSPKRLPVVAPWMQRLAADTYFADAAVRRLPLASPLFDPGLAAGMPPALVLTGGLDTLGPEMDALAARLAAEGVPVTHRRFPDADHVLTHGPPLAVAREAIGLIGDHLRRHLAYGSSEGGSGAP